MFKKTLVVGSFQCNCVILGCERTKEAVVIDPGDEAPAILAALRKEGLQAKYLLHTHAHFDHVGATAAVKAGHGGTVCLHRADEPLYSNLSAQGRFFGMTLESAPPLEKHLEDCEILSVGDFTVEVLHTPGHSPGSVCFRVGGATEELFSGDTLFKQSVGRTDLWGGSAKDLVLSIKNRLLRLDDDLPVHPGHGPSTTIGLEKRTNPFLI